MAQPWPELVWRGDKEAVHFIRASSIDESNRTEHPRARICTSLSAGTVSDLAEKASRAFALGTDLVEFRLDSLKSPDFDRITRALEDFAGRSIFTVRPPSEGGKFRRRESDRLALIRNLRGLNPAYVDVELRTLAANRSLLPKSVGNGIIVSWHDLTGTPGRFRLLSIAARAARYGGVVKIVTTAKVAGDNLTVLSLYDQPGPPPIAFCMGSLGVLSRVISMEKGCPIAYGSLPGEPIAPGQPSTVQLLAVRRVLEHG